METPQNPSEWKIIFQKFQQANKFVCIQINKALLVFAARHNLFVFTRKAVNNKLSD